MKKQQVIYDLSRDYGLKPCPFCNKIPQIKLLDLHSSKYGLDHTCKQGENSIEVHISPENVPTAVAKSWNKYSCAALETIKTEDIESKSTIKLSNGYIDSKIVRD